MPSFHEAATTSPKREERRWHEFVRFVLVGGANTVATYGLYLLFLRLVSYPKAYTASYAAGILISYYLNAHFVFKERLRLVKALQFPMVYVAQYVAGMALLYILVETAHLSPRLAPIIIVVVTVPLTYFLSRYVIKGDFAHWKTGRKSSRL